MDKKQGRKCQEQSMKSQISDKCDITDTEQTTPLCWLDGAVREEAWVPRVVARTVVSVLGSSWIGLEFVVGATTTDLQRQLSTHLCFQEIYHVSFLAVRNEMEKEELLFITAKPPCWICSAV